MESTNVGEPLAVCWFRRDLRLTDNTALYHALSGPHRVLPLFVFDTNILDKLPSRADRRVDFIHQRLGMLQRELLHYGSSFVCWHGTPDQAFDHLLAHYRIAAVYTNTDYEPYARERDTALAQRLSQAGVAWHSFKDHVVFQHNEVCKADDSPYTVFTPYSKRWKALLAHRPPQPLASEKLLHRLWQTPARPICSLKELGFEAFEGSFEEKWPLNLAPEQLEHYAQRRDFPAIEGTTRAGIHLRFGTLSIRRAVALALQWSPTWLDELIWREFFFMILWHFPHSATRSFRSQYDALAWHNNEHQFQAWCQGQTGYPIVDAGMRQLVATGFMHNRTRMIAASFLAKHLLIDWRWGEAFFAQHLNDFDLAANVGGWQWAASTGCDAVPYFRIFNPNLQTKRFDPQMAYIRQWVPEWQSVGYPRPVVEHEYARARALAAYKAVQGPRDTGSQALLF